MHNTNNKHDYIFKLIIIGDPNVGKSSILSNFLYGEYNENYEITVGVEFGSKTITLNNDKKAKLQIWDTAGQENFKSITRSYYRSSAGAIIVFDLTNKQSFENISKWLEECRINANSLISIILIGNKSDLPNREVSIEEINHVIASRGLDYIETSAKDSLNIENLFMDISNKINEKIENGIISIEDENYGVKKNFNYIDSSSKIKTKFIKNNNSNNTCC